jgi:hypothetical protein
MLMELSSRFRGWLLRLILGMVLAGLVGLACFIVRPALSARKALQLAAATEVGRTSLEDFQKMARDYGVTLGVNGDTFWAAERNRVLEYLHLAPETIVAVNARTSHGVIDLVEVIAWIGKYQEFARIRIKEFDTRQTGCGDAPTCVKPTSSTMTTTVFFIPSTPQNERTRLLSLNTWCLAKVGGCGSSREFFPVAWQNKIK